MQARGRAAAKMANNKNGKNLRENTTPIMAKPMPLVMANRGANSFGGASFCCTRQSPAA